VATIDTERERFDELAVDEIESHLAALDLAADDRPADPGEEDE
jgi:hypothetical protein